jgi:transposase
MFRLAVDVQVYLHREAIDFRIGINGLAILVEQAMHLDPFICVGDNYVAALRRGWISAPRAGLAAT